MTDKTDVLTRRHARLVDSVDGWQQASDRMKGAPAALVVRVLDGRKSLHAELHDPPTSAGIKVAKDVSTAAAGKEA